VLANVGAVEDVAGTPAYTAPEIVRGLPVDGRADLYALGVLGYAMVTGRKPYDAQSMQELESWWSRPVPPPSSFAPVPEALEDLILDLLCLEPLGRPPSATLLIDRLTTLGGLDPDPGLLVTPGFSESAAMVGRKKELRTLSKLYAKVKGGGSRAFVIEAESGTGKTRLLQELAIRVKLEGGLVLRVSCEEADGGPFAALAALIDEAFVAAPDEAKAATEASASLLGRIFESVRRAHPRVVPEREVGEPTEDRVRMQEAFMRAIRALASARPVALLVDDIQRCDEASAAGLAGLARGAVPGLLIGFARRLAEPVRAPAAVASLSTLQPLLRLSGLDAEGVKALLRSSFGDAPRLSRLANWLTRTTGGSPMFCIELTRHMVENGAIHHDGSTWILPEDVTQTGAPERLADAMRHRVEGLPGPARAIGEVLAVQGGEADLERVLALSEAIGLSMPEGGAGAGSAAPSTPNRAEVVFSALDELVQQHVVVDTGERVRFKHDSLREALLGGIEPEQRRRLHRHVGHVLLEAGGGDDPAAEAEVGWHLYRGGDEQRGAEMLERAGRSLYEAQARADCVAPLATALEVRERNGAPKAVIGDLSYMLATAGWTSNREAGEKHAQRPIEIYADLSGINAATRMKRWLGWRLALFLAVIWASLRWLFRRGEARGPGPLRALSFFAVSLVNAVAIAYTVNHKDLVARLVARAEPLTAFKGQTPFSAYLSILAMTDILHGRFKLARDRLSAAIELVHRPRLNPLTNHERMLIEGSMRCIRNIIDANQFDARMDEDLAAIDATGLTSYRHSADTARVVRHRYRGEEAKARALEAQIEPTSLQLSSWSVDLMRVYTAHVAYPFTHDLEGLKQGLDALERRAAEGMELSVRIAFTRAEIQRERGEYDQALKTAVPVLEALGPDEHLYRQFLASTVAQTALESYQYDLAARYARVGLEDAREYRMLMPWLRSQRVLGLAEDALGQPKEGAARLERAIGVAEAHDCPVLAGELHEARARIAFAAKDRLLFEVHRAKCAAWLRPTENPGLIAVVERLAELDRLDRDDSLPEADPRRRRPGVSTETTGGGDSTSGDSEPDAATRSEVLVDSDTIPGSRPPVTLLTSSAVSSSYDEAEEATSASSPRALAGKVISEPGEESEEATSASSPRALSGKVISEPGEGGSQDD
jgi:hypothetical protein